MAIENIELKKDLYSERANDALNLTFCMAADNRYEFVTPEMLLYTICLQDEFRNVCKAYNVDIEGMEQSCMEYFDMQDRIPADLDYVVMLSLDFGKLIKFLNDSYYVNSQDVGRISIPDFLVAIDQLEDSVAKFLLNKYFGEVTDDWDIPLAYAYRNDMDCIEDNDYEKIDELGIDEINALSLEECNNDKDESDEDDTQDPEMTQEYLFGKLMASAGRLMGAIHSLNNSVEMKDERQEDKRPAREPWEDLVTCINDTYASKNPLIGRDVEMQRAIRILCRKDKNNPLFIGESGVGKTAIIYGLARMIDEGNVPEWLCGQRIYALEMSTMVAGSSYHGEFEKRMKAVLEGARNRGNSIIYIDEIHTIMGSGGNNNSTSAVDMLKPYLEDGALRFIGSTTYQDFNRQMANNKAIVRRFQQIDIKEPTIDETVEIINGLLPNYEAHHGVKYAPDAVRYAIEQSDSLIHDRFLPDKAIDIIDEAGAFLQQNPLLDKNGKPKQKRYQKVDVGIVKQILTDVCRIDAKALAAESNTDLKNLDKRISADIYGQDDAIRHVVRSVMMAKAGLNEPNKPIASLLFVGPTGVGKTEVCKVLSRELGMELIRFDMSEYTEKHTISKLIGSPAGYVGYDEGGLLTDAVRKTPNCVLLLDEIEKAHTDIYNILLQVMDYARLTDNKGNKVDFRNSIIIMTSNAGAQHASQAAIGFSGGQTKGQAMLASVKKTFKPEFLNRLSATVVFNDMDRHMASLILDKKIRQLAERAKAKNVTLSISKPAHEYLLDKGFSTLYGAREMDRAIQQHLIPQLMEEILFGKLKKGGEVKVEKEGEGLTCVKD